MTNKITHAVDATPYPVAPSIWIAFPQYDDWLNVIDPSQNKYDAMKSQHKQDVKKKLDLISSKSTGQAVFAELRDRPSYSVMIFPFAFAPDVQQPRTVATTVPLEGPAATEKDWPLTLPGIIQRVCDKHQVCRRDTGTGTGSAVDIYYWPGPEEFLLHELVHASRNVKGVARPNPLGGPKGLYPTEEEFYATLVENMYLSQWGKGLSHYNGDPFDAKDFLDSDFVPGPRYLIYQFGKRQPTLFGRLKDLQAPFNPIQQYWRVP